MGIFKTKNGGFMDVIRCDEPAYLIWKWHPTGSQKKGKRRENEIRWGSSLRVKDGEVAVFVYNQNDGIMQDFIEGPYDQIIETANFPVLASIIGLAFDGFSPFQAEVYFINLARIIQVKFGVPFFDVYDPRFDDFGVPVAVRGTISFRIEDYREFIKLHRMDSFSLETFQTQIRDAVSRYVKDVVTNAPATHNIPVVQIETRISQINDVIEYTLSERLKESFGVVTSSVDINAIEIDKASPGYKQLMAVTKDLASATLQAETEAKIKDIHDKQRIESENYKEMLKIQREEAQYAQRKQTQSANIEAFQVEKQTEVGVAGANALGQMGLNGAGNIKLDDGGSSGFNPSAMMASIAVGSSIGQNIAGIMNNVMSGINRTTQQEVTPPPIPNNVYYLVVNGQASGPYDLKVLQKMAATGQLNADSLVWKNGMAEWVKAGTIEELNSFFEGMPSKPSAE